MQQTLPGIRKPCFQQCFSGALGDNKAIGCGPARPLREAPDSAVPTRDYAVAYAVGIVLLAPGGMVRFGLIA